MKVGTTSTTKFKRLKRRLRLPEYAVAGLLELLWNITAKDAPQGDLGRLEDEDIAANIEWEGDPAELINHLVDCKWLVLDEKHRFIVNDWHEHCPNYVKGNLVKKGLKFATGQTPKANPKAGTKERPKDKPKGTRSEGVDNRLNTPTTNSIQFNSIQENTAAAAGDAQTKGADESLLPPPTNSGKLPSWQTVIEQLRMRGIQHAAPTAFAARDNGCTISEVVAVVNHYDFRKCYDANQLCSRIQRSRPGQLPDDGWPVRNSPTETRSKASKIEQEAAQEENRLVRLGRQANATDDDIRKKIRASFEAQNFPLKYSTWCNEEAQ